eukprot:809379-Pleurochrysis_carterae.AAC.1
MITVTSQDDLSTTTLRLYERSRHWRSIYVVKYVENLSLRVESRNDRSIDISRHFSKRDAALTTLPTQSAFLLPVHACARHEQQDVQARRAHAASPARGPQILRPAAARQMACLGKKTKLHAPAAP